MTTDSYNGKSLMRSSKTPDAIYGDTAKPTHEHSPLAGNSTQTSNSTQTPTTSADILTALDEVLIGRKKPILIAHTWQAYTTKVSIKS